MNIKQAKEQIKNAMTAYFAKDELGNYEIPVERQRPVFLNGAPGIGKTAVMEQIAAELGVGLVSYSMTHHTRQSALGLPFIVKRNYGGVEFDVSEYTMSEIIASVYELMEKTGAKEGILFLDEINCVSETLAPSMLQFLQYKVFGRHRVPDGWIVVTAGNPPEYNRSVREFDIATWDRLKRIDVEPDFDAWKEYACNRGVHPAIMTYLEIKKDCFYSVETTVTGKLFVTARGWDDLSSMIKVYEKNGIGVDLSLIQQYIQNPKIAKDFSVYYDMYNKYKSDYQIDAILSGEVSSDIKKRASEAEFSERLALIGLLLDSVKSDIISVIYEENTLSELLVLLKSAKPVFVARRSKPADIIEAYIKKQKQRLESAQLSFSLSPEKQRTYAGIVNILQFYGDEIVKNRLDSDGDEAFEYIKNLYNGSVADMKNAAAAASVQLENMFRFCAEVFGGEQELLILVTELTVNRDCARFIGEYGSEEYYKYNKSLLFFERRRDIIEKIDSLQPGALV